MHNVHAVYDGVFNTVSGIEVNLLNPTPEMIRIEDIAVSLSKINRFGGHTFAPYNVAQHSIIVCAMAPDHLKREALLHDATEAYLGDVIKPLKVLLGPIYRMLEEIWTAAIAKKFGLDLERLSEVKQCDRRAVEIEHEFLQRNNDFPWYDTLLELGFDGCIWDCSGAERMFLTYYQHLFL